MNGQDGYDENWTNIQKYQISALLTNTNRELPTEIHRAVRTLKDVRRWKGTEFRTVLLYVGMVVFKKFLPADIFNHFLLLSASVIICSTDAYQNFRPKAREMFAEYVEDMIHLYDSHSISSNFHNLIHIVDDVERFGNLNTISAYEFENFLGQIKTKIFSYNRPLEQVARRLIERSNVNLQKTNLNSTFKISVKYAHQRDDTMLAFNEITYRPNVLLSNRSFGDRWFLTTTNKIAEMQYAFRQNDQYFVSGTVIVDRDDFFKYPFSSRHINILQSKMQKGTEQKFKICEIKAKLICLSSQEDFVFMPLLHSL